MQPIGIFGLGEMGSSFARLFSSQGVEAVSCLEGRTEATKRRASEAGVTAVSSVAEVVERCELILSIAPSSAVFEIAEQVAAAITQQPPLFVDCNAISPETAKQLAKITTRAGGRFADASIVGPPIEPGKATTFYVSGAESPSLLSLRGLQLNVELIGDEIGQASGFKMLYAGLTKGLSALSTELLVTAAGLGLADQIMQKYHRDFPGLAQLIERLIPSLPFRAARRSIEMQELDVTMRSAGLEPSMPLAAAEVLRRIGEMRLESRFSSQDEEGWSWNDVVEIFRQEITDR